MPQTRSSLIPDLSSTKRDQIPQLSTLMISRINLDLGWFNSLLFMFMLLVTCACYLNTNSKPREKKTDSAQEENIWRCSKFKYSFVATCRNHWIKDNLSLQAHWIAHIISPYTLFNHTVIWYATGNLIDMRIHNHRRGSKNLLSAIIVYLNRYFIIYQACVEVTLHYYW
jgi:hypothetical protein